MFCEALNKLKINVLPFFLYFQTYLTGNQWKENQSYNSVTTQSVKLIREDITKLINKNDSHVFSDKVENWISLYPFIRYNTKLCGIRENRIANDLYFYHQGIRWWGHLFNGDGRSQMNSGKRFNFVLMRSERLLSAGIRSLPI